MVRIKNRYIVLKVNLTGREKYAVHLNKVILAAVERMHGEFGTASLLSCLVIKYISVETGIAIIKARFGPHRLLLSSLPVINSSFSYGSRVESINVLYVGASVKQCLLFIKNYQMDKFEEATYNLRSEDRLRIYENYKLQPINLS